MLNSSKTFTSPVMETLGVDPKLLMINPLSQDALVAAINEAIPTPPPCADEFSVPDLVSDDGNSQISSSPPSSPQIYAYPSSQYVRISCGSPYPPTTFVRSHDRSAARVLIDAPCAGGRPVKQKGGGYICPTCNKVFRRRDDAARHTKSAGTRVPCRYCGKLGIWRGDAQLRHLKSKKCLKAQETSRKAGLFIERTVEDAFN